MVPGDSPVRLERILAAVDFSPRSAEALSVATAIGAAAGIERCDVVHVRFDASAAAFDEYQEALAEQDEYDFGLFTARIDTHGVDLQPILRESADLPGTILRTADECGSSLIVMGTRGRGRASAAILGSETEEVLSASTVPVLAVKRAGTQLRLLDALRERPSRRGGDFKFS
jgi:nucleotide-binding universal stress UspA family protein